MEAEYTVIRKNYNGAMSLPVIADRIPQLIQPTRPAGPPAEDARATPFHMWRRTNVVPQRQAGFSAAFIRLPMGDIPSAQMREVADIIDEFANGNIRTTIQQNLCIRWVANDRIEDLYRRLVEANLGDPGAELVEDIIACPGTDTCGLGITSSKGLARALAEIFPPGHVPDDLRDVTVKISGCHNSCAQHHISTIGLHGVGKRLGDHVAPHYELHLGGRIDGTPKIGQMTIKLPAKNVPSAVSHLLDVWRRDRREGESLLDFIDRTGKAKLKEELIPYSILPSFDADPAYYFDWEGEEEFILEDLGPGECAGGALEMIENRILEAEQEMYQARLLEGKSNTPRRSIKPTARCLPRQKRCWCWRGWTRIPTPRPSLSLNDASGRTAGLPRYAKPTSGIGDLGPKDTTAAFAREKMSYAKGFIEACKELTEAMGKTLMTKDSQETAKSAGPAPLSTPAPDAATTKTGDVGPARRDVPDQLREDQAQARNDGRWGHPRGLAGCRRTHPQCSTVPSQRWPEGVG